MSKPKRIQVVVELVVPEGAAPDDCLGYVYSAVCSWRGGLEPPNDGGCGEWTDGDPLFFLDSEQVSARLLKRRLPMKQGNA